MAAYIITNLELVKYFQKAVDEHWGYVWSLNGVRYTQAMANEYKATGESTSKWRNPETYWTVDCKRWIGKMAADCSGGIVGAFRTKKSTYKDRKADTFKSQFVKSGKIATIPEVPGLAVWRKGHIGIYEGNGKVLEFRGTEYGAVRTELSKRNFTHWGMLKEVAYVTTSTKEEAWVVSRLLKLDSPMLRGDDVRELQNRLKACKYNPGTVDGVFGPKTEAAVKKYQKARGLEVDGKAGKNTITALGGVWKG